MPRRHRVIARLIERTITAGEVRAGQDLPSSSELATRYRASSAEVRLALSRLASDGLLTVGDDGNATVRQPPTRPHPMSSPTRLHKNLIGLDDIFTEEGNDLTSIQQSETTIGPSSLEVADRLEINIGQEIVHTRTVWLADAQPSVLEDHYYPHEVVSTVDLASTRDPGQALDAAGCIPLGWQDSVAARRPSPEEESLLALEHDAPVLDLTRVLYAMTAEQVVRPVAYTRLLFAGDRNRVTYQHKEAEAPRLGTANSDGRRAVPSPRTLGSDW